MEEQLTTAKDKIKTLEKELGAARDYIKSLESDLAKEKQAQKKKRSKSPVDINVTTTVSFENLGHGMKYNIRDALARDICRLFKEIKEAIGEKARNIAREVMKKRLLELLPPGVSDHRVDFVSDNQVTLTFNPGTRLDLKTFFTKDVSEKVESSLRNLYKEFARHKQYYNTIMLTFTRPDIF